MEEKPINEFSNSTISKEPKVNPDSLLTVNLEKSEPDKVFSNPVDEALLREQKADTIAREELEIQQLEEDIQKFRRNIGSAFQAAVPYLESMGKVSRHSGYPPRATCPRKFRGQFWGRS